MKDNFKQPIGLTSAEVDQRTKEGKVNRAVNDQAKTTWQIIKENTFTYFNLIFLVLSILLVIVGEYKDLTFLPVIIANMIIGIVQELRAKRVLDKLNVMNTTKISVIRDGKEEVIPIEDLVLGDVIVLQTGDQIPADGQVISGTLRVNEALLTGEADEIEKDVGSELMSGSFVVSGKAYARLEKVGKNSYVSKLTLEAKSMNSKEGSEMVRSINRLIKWVGIIIPCGIALFIVARYVNHLNLADSVVSMEAAVIGMIPEGLYLLTTIALALAAMRLARSQVMLHDMKSVETLARVNVLCVDKTGTITEPKMEVEKIIPVNTSTDNLAKNISIFAQNMPHDNATIKAVADAFNQKSNIRVKKIIPFTSVNKYSGAVIDENTLLMGAPEFVLRDQFKDYEKEINQYTSQGYRVLAFAQYPEALEDEKQKLSKEVELLGYILISNPIRKEAKSTFKYFERRGVNVKVISGDNPITVARVAKQAGIKDADKLIDATEIGEGDYEEVVKKYNVFGRVKPDQKKKLIKALQKNGNTVAMTGDGVNDILAMKSADCSIAMASGNSAAVQASQVVLLDSDFARMPKVVDEGRKVVNNIERSASLFLVKNIFSFLMAIFSLVFAMSYPLRPAQIALISAFTIGLPSFLLALENNYNRIRGKFIPNVLSRAIPGGITDMLAVSILVVADMVLALGRQEVATTATMLLVAVGMMVLYHISRPLNKFRWTVLGGSFLALVLAVIFFHNLFALSRISATAVFLLLVLFFAEITIFRFLSKFADGVREVLVVYDQKGKDLTLNDIKHAYSKGRNLVNMPSGK